MSNDIIDSFARIRVAFVAVNLKPPASINLASREDGMRFLSEVAQTNMLVFPGDSRLGALVEMADGAVFMECELMGMKVRWPASRFAMPDGSWRFA